MADSWNLYRLVMAGIYLKMRQIVNSISGTINLQVLNKVCDSVVQRIHDSRSVSLQLFYGMSQ
jgi:hypothetical protein